MLSWLEYRCMTLIESVVENKIIPPAKLAGQLRCAAPSGGDMLEKLPELVNRDVVLVRRGRWLSDTFMVEVGDDQYLIHVRAGRIDTVEKGPFVMRSWTFAVRASAEVWKGFWEPLPKPGFHDVFALLRKGRSVLEGNLHPFIANLLYVKGVLAAPRSLGDSA
jgi:hypothetical protein